MLDKLLQKAYNLFKLGNDDPSSGLFAEIGIFNQFLHFYLFFILFSVVIMLLIALSFSLSNSNNTYLNSVRTRLEISLYDHSSFAWAAVLEFFWTLLPVVFLFNVGLISFLVLFTDFYNTLLIRNDVLGLTVTGFQWFWKYSYYLF